LSEVNNLKSSIKMHQSAYMYANHLRIMLDSKGLHNISLVLYAQYSFSIFPLDIHRYFLKLFHTLWKCVNFFFFLIHLFTYLFIYLFVHLFIYLFFFFWFTHISKVFLSNDFLQQQNAFTARACTHTHCVLYTCIMSSTNAEYICNIANWSCRLTWEK
jgi:hypothetical protein